MRIPTLLLTILLIIPISTTQADKVCAVLHAEQPAERPITSSIALHLGSASVRNTYLAPLLYQGADIALGYERSRHWKDLRWHSLQSVTGQFIMGSDKGDHTESLAGRIRYRYATHYGIGLQRWTLSVGPYVGTDIGFDYNLKMSSGNNPATAHVTINAGASVLGAVSYNIRRRACQASLLVQMPLAGYACMPEYGASYYESFYLKNTQGLHHFTSLHNQQDLDIQLQTDIPLRTRSSGALRIGCGFHIETMQINHTNTRLSSLNAIIGWTFQCIPVKYNAKGLSYEAFWPTSSASYLFDQAASGIVCHRIVHDDGQPDIMPR